jgi:hypothetical protein
MLNYLKFPRYERFGEKELENTLISAFWSGKKITTNVMSALTYFVPYLVFVLMIIFFKGYLNFKPL